MCLTIRKGKGFTLIEAMIVLAVISILMSVAVSAYRSQTERTRRAEAKQFLLDMANKQESFYTQFLSYTTVVAGPGGCAGIACGLGYSSNQSTSNLYTASITTLPAGCAPGGATACTSYTLTATSNVVDLDCVTLTYTSANVRGNTGTGTVDECWR